MNIEQDLALEMVRVVEAAAIAAARTMGQGDRDGSDQVAVSGDARGVRGTAHRWNHRHR